MSHPRPIHPRMFVALVIACLVVLGVACESKSEAGSGEGGENEAATGAPESEGASEAAAGGTETAEGDESSGEAPSKASAFDGETRAETLPGLAFEVPAEWENIPPSSPMRKAQFKLPGDTDEPSLAVFRFPGGGGTRQANIDRWLGQFQIDGAPATAETAEIETFEVGDLTVTTVYVSGTYVAAMRPGAPQKMNESGYRMLAAIIEGSGDAYYFKATGPEATVKGWEPGFEHLVRSATIP